MPEDLYGAGAQILGERARSVSEGQKAESEQQRTIAQQGEAAGTQLGEDRRQKEAALQRIKQIDEQGIMQGHMMKISPQVATGLVKETGDPGWLQSIGQTMPTGYVLGSLKASTIKKNDGKINKVTIGDKEHSILQSWNPASESWDFKDLGAGEKFSPTAKGEDTPKAKADRLAREKAAREKAAGGGGKESVSDKEFMKTYRQYQKDTEGINYQILDQMAKRDSKQEGDLKRKLDFISQNQDRFNKVQGVSDQSGGKDQLPPQAQKAIQDAKGQPVTFANGQTWKWENGKAVKTHG